MSDERDERGKRWSAEELVCTLLSVMEDAATEIDKGETDFAVEILRARIEVTKSPLAEALKQLRTMVEMLENHYCGVCGNGGGDVDQPYRDVADLEVETCSGCRETVEALLAARDLVGV